MLSDGLASVYRTSSTWQLTASLSHHQPVLGDKWASSSTGDTDTQTGDLTNNNKQQLSLQSESNQTTGMLVRVTVQLGLGGNKSTQLCLTQSDNLKTRRSTGPSLSQREIYQHRARVSLTGVRPGWAAGRVQEAGVDVCVRGCGVGDAHLRLSVDLQCLGGKL